MRTSGDAALKVRKMTIKDSETTLVNFVDPSQPKPVVTKASDLPVVDPHVVVSRKK